ncbi:MAG: hypothetical protein EXX96DRAFT_554588 [Benjaminiella poitrasii]|nr:MAG: hypothetical protein EXX96DRAFT_554588 [Benjaminiella poitrasii]
MVELKEIVINHKSPYHHQGAYVLHLPIIDNDRPEISPNIQNSYIQQNLPVRRQSLIAYHDKLKSDQSPSHPSSQDEDPQASPPKRQSSLHFDGSTIAVVDKRDDNKLSNSKSLNSIGSLPQARKLGRGNRIIPRPSPPPLSIQTSALLQDFNSSKSPSTNSCSSDSPNEFIMTTPSDTQHCEENGYQRQQRQSIPKFIGLLRPSKSDIGNLCNKKSLIKSTTDDTNNPAVNSQSWNDMSQPLSKLRNVFYRLQTSPTSQMASSQSKTKRTSSLINNESNKKKKKSPSLDSGSNSKMKKERLTRCYYALLSHLSKEFLKRMHVSTIAFKDGIQYHDVFHGVEAVDCIARILRVKDRNLALLVGRSLENQGLFHHVHYDCRLRDTENELYQFQYMQPEADLSSPATLSRRPPIPSQFMSSPTTPTSNKFISLSRRSNKKQVPFVCETVPVSGVFSILTDCYSPTCTKNNPCYSISCPRMITHKQKSLQRPLSSHVFRTKQEKQLRSLWRHSVPTNIVLGTNDIEKKRQESIYELIYTEEDFVKDLQYIRNFWTQPLQMNDIIPVERKDEFIKDVFWNLADIEHTSTALSRELNLRQDKHSIIPSVGDIMLKHAENFEPFVIYGAHQIFGKHKYELEKKKNPKFLQFVQKVERCPESRRLELNAYLTKPTSRLGRYNLLLNAIHQVTPKDHQDYHDIPKVIHKITEYLILLNKQAGLADNAFHLEQISSRILTTKGIELNLQDSSRRLLMRGKMKRSSSLNNNNSHYTATSPVIESSTMNIQLFLFDHYLVFCKIKKHDGLDYYKIFQKPIPLKNLDVTIPNLVVMIPSIKSNIYSKMSPSTSAFSETANGFPITFRDTVNAALSISLIASTESIRKLWLDKIREEQQKHSQ